MKNFYLALFLTTSFIGISQVPDTVSQGYFLHSTFLRDFAYNSENSFMAVYSGRIFRWERDGDTSSFVISNMRSYNNIFRLSDGNFVVMGKTNDFFGMLAKIDSSGSVIWETDIRKDNSQSTLRALHEKADGSLIVGGGASSKMLLINLDANGDTTKAVFYPTYSFTGITDIAETSDGNYLVSGFSDDYPLAAKIDANLDTSWTFFETIFISFSQIRSFEQSNGNFDMYAGNVRVTLDANGQKVLDTVHLNSHNVNDAVADPTGFLSVGSYGGWSGPDRGLSLVKFSAAGDSLGAYTYTVPDFIGGYYRRIIELPNGNFAALGYIRDSVSTPNPGEYQNVITIFGQGGNADQMELSLRQKVSIYPNPARELFRIKNYDAPVRVVNSQGKTVIKQLSPVGDAYPTGSLHRGLYFVLNAHGEYLGPLVIK